MSFFISKECQLTTASAVSIRLNANVMQCTRDAIPNPFASHDSNLYFDDLFTQMKQVRQELQIDGCFAGHIISIRSFIGQFLAGGMDRLLEYFSDSELVHPQFQDWR